MNVKNWTILFFLFVFVSFTAQIKNPVKFQFKINDLGDKTYEAVLDATIESGWHIYSKDIPEDTGIPTQMTVKSKQGITPVGATVEVGTKHDEFSEAFNNRIVYYSDQVLFKQKFKLKDTNKPADIEVEIMYQTCNDQTCLAPKTLSFHNTVTPQGITKGNIPDTKKDSIKPSVDYAKSSKSATVPSPPKALSQDNGLKIASIDITHPLSDCVVDETKSESNLWVFILGFLGGLIALLTPCVFPMIPLTVSFFTKAAMNKSKGRRDAMIYGFFILLIFVLLSVPFHIINGISGNIFNQISTNIWLNLFFFAIFLFFALSFFGYYEITLPSSLANKSSRAEEAGGIIGIFFMALTLVIVSFSCTGPILGSLLGSVASSSKNVPMMLTFALAGFGLAWALIFGLLALFPQALQSLPKSGGWMTTVKVVLGFIELALALKFLSKADLVSKTFLLKREIFIGIWILITLGLVAYLFGFIKFPHDDKHTKISTTRKILGIIGIAFAIYLVPGLIKSEEPKLQALSGILPPLNVSLYANEKDGILGMHPEHDYFTAIEKAKKANKPVLIDFTGYGCENCRKMEEFVWSQPDILPLLQNDVILTSLYVDDKEKLPEDKQFSVDMGDGSQTKIKTIGDKWATFQQVNFKNNSQPHYALVTPDGKVINTPVSGYMDKEKFKHFLECGINHYKSIK